MAYSLNQQTFVLSMMSNMASALVPPPANDPVQNAASYLADQLTAIINQAFQNTGFCNYMGTWTLAWGPYVYVSGQDDNALYADNVMFVAKSMSNGNPVYVVAMSATSGNSTYDILTEDLGSKTLVSLYTGKSTNSDPQISVGNWDGLSALLGLNSANNGQTIDKYLNSVANKSATLIFTGHSLGGGLAPILASALFSQDSNAAYKLQTSSWNAVNVFPTAGPSTGDAAFVKLFPKTFGNPTTGDGVNSPCWNGRYYNSYDIVPVVWSSTDEVTLSLSLNRIYDSIISGVKPCVSAIIDYAVLGRPASTYKQLPVANKFEGTLQSNWPPPPANVNWTCSSNTFKYLREADYQHIYAYMVQLQVLDVMSILFSAANGPANPFSNYNATTGTKNNAADNFSTELHDKLVSSPFSACVSDAV